MTQQDLQNALAAIAHETVQLLAEHGLQSHCIDGAAVLTKALQKVGISGAHQVAAGLIIVNASYQKYVSKYDPPQNEASTRAFNDSEAAAVELGKDAAEVPEGFWAGHLVPSPASHRAIARWRNSSRSV